MDPWGATAPMDWWTLVNRTRALENTAYVVASNQGASFQSYPPFSWPGGSMVVDFDGRILAEASPGPGERVVVAPIDIDALRYARESAGGMTCVRICDPSCTRTRASPTWHRRQIPRRSRLRALSAHRRGQEASGRAVMRRIAVKSIVAIVVVVIRGSR